MSSLMESLRDAMNSHDPQQVASLVAQDYESNQPAHPARAFSGREQVLANWSAVFDGVRDFSAELVAAVVDGENEWANGRGAVDTPTAPFSLCAESSSSPPATD